MNMMSRGCQLFLERTLPPGTPFCLSGNFCTDKKPSAVNWIGGRGRSVVVEVEVNREVLGRVLKVTDAESFARFCREKCLIGSAVAGSLGGFNAQVANVLAAAYLALGQDIAQVVDGAVGLLSVESTGEGVIASLTLPCLELGMIGGGTGLPLQRHYLKLTGVEGVDELAVGVGVACLAGELSLMGALWNAGELVSAHSTLNSQRK